jgi:hypothetical protein
MILPSKHITFSESLLGFGSYVLSKLDAPVTVDEIWKHYNEDFIEHKFNAKQTFDNLLLTLIFLYGIGAIKHERGLVHKCN